VSVSTPNNGNRVPRGRGGAGGRRRERRDAMPPKSRLEPGHRHVHPSVPDADDTQNAIRLGWHQTAMRVVLIAVTTIMPTGMIVVLSMSGFEPDQIVRVLLIAGGGAGVGAAAGWLAERHGKERVPAGSASDSRRSF